MRHLATHGQFKWGPFNVTSFLHASGDSIALLATMSFHQHFSIYKWCTTFSRSVKRCVNFVNVYHIYTKHYRNYPKYSDTLNVRTRYFFLKRHLFYVPYISEHVPNRVFLLSINVRTQKNRSLISHKTFIFHFRIILAICSVYLCFR